MGERRRGDTGKRVGEGRGGEGEGGAGRGRGGGREREGERVKDGNKVIRSVGVRDEE